MAAANPLLSKLGVNVVNKVVNHKEIYGFCNIPGPERIRLDLPNKLRNRHDTSGQLCLPSVLASTGHGILLSKVRLRSITLLEGEPGSTYSGNP